MRVLSDERNHASIVDGCRLSRAEICVYRHGDVDHVEDAAPVGARAGRWSSPTPSSPWTATWRRSRRWPSGAPAHGALLVLDEAHAVLGPDPDLAGVDHLRVGTLSKYLGSLGGFVAGPRPFVDLLVNRARPFIFTTASSPADAGAALAAVGVLRSPEGDRLVAALRANVDLRQAGAPLPYRPDRGGRRRGCRGRIAGAARARACSCPPSARPRSPPGRPGCGSRSRPTHTAGQIARLLDGLEAVGCAP